MKTTRITSIAIAVLIFTQQAAAQTDSNSVKVAKVPFEGFDLTWINGQNRQTDFPLALNDKAGETILTGVAFMDGYYNYDFNNPIDNTHTSSSSIGRCNEFTLNTVSFGIESYYKNIIGRVWLQYGQMAAIVQDLDGSVGHGRNTSINNLRYIREAAAGYHFDKWYGINAEMGIFGSYIGLESYVINENWSYQRSMSSDFTPFYFSGARLQMFPSKKLKQEIWLLNGWQTYNSWNQGLGFGSSTYWRPTTNLQLAANFYLAGRDTRNNPDVTRYHHDHSIVARYYKDKIAKGISQAAFSINNHYGFQTGNGVLADKNYMAGTSIANRIWFNRNKLALTLRGDYVTNPGAYMAFNPSPVAANDYNDALAAGKTLDIIQATATFDLMPTDHFAFRLEYGYRGASVPYFAGSGGTTSPDGWMDTPNNTWRPDLVNNEGRVTVAVNFRL
ncbi:MAG: porin [Taibaiella sp.]|nr:porin [Taibaiella sp.]